MTRAEDKPSGESEISETSVEHPSGSIGPNLGIEGLGNGYVSSEVIEEDKGVFYNPRASLKYFDDLSRENIVCDADTSARILENYIGQHSRADEQLEEFLEDMPVKQSEIDGLESSFVMELDLFHYDGNQHLKYSEGEIAREAVEYLAEESDWSDDLYFLEDEEKLFIRNSP